MRTRLSRTPATSKIGTLPAIDANFSRFDGCERLQLSSLLYTPSLQSADGQREREIWQQTTTAGKCGSHAELCSTAHRGNERAQRQVPPILCAVRACGAPRGAHVYILHILVRTPHTIRKHLLASRATQTTQTSSCERALRAD